ncbi:LOW QUALITY PROTEIN: hypothetical protein PNEG_04270 [Pneumocystis murina B123]|uniref:Uncharacterized protein n=1 Tax=Pneumocystis murina (strain B123) TaxID=1069680 RepID=A0A0W4ZX24_PNEMU|nr:LOW QUALITY PROTEIN: hypothetical protein PNEG_04270 [Pneumocystis murina B123]KTW32917.1 LOW QUALITY PROTEIN: hypothetical protein PNEG_04270 [Pneumocystis murina B123]
MSYRLIKKVGLLSTISFTIFIIALNDNVICILIIYMNYIITLKCLKIGIRLFELRLLYIFKYELEMAKDI